MTAPIAAIVVTYNSEQYIDQLLDSLPAAFGDLDRRVVIVDNGSTDATVSLVEARSDVLLVRSTNVGFAGGINVGVAHLPGTGAVLVLNPDATLGAGSIPAMRELLDRPGIGVVVPRMVEADGALSFSLRREPTLLRAGGLSFTGLPALAERIEDPEDYVDEHLVDWAVGAAMLIDRDCYDALGGFDESFFLYSEETDFCLRARDAGWLTLYTPDAEMMHVGGGSGESAATHTMKMVNRVRLFGRRNDPVRTWLYYGIVVVNELRRGVMGHRRSWPTVRALVRPRLRPPQLRASDRLIPR